jgi:prepilin-type processing-associated H-X9-DG protein
MRRALVLAGWVVGTLAALSICAGCVFPSQLFFDLGLGWVLYLVRVVPQITVNWNGVLTAAICLVALPLGLHRFLQWFYVQNSKLAENARTDRVWPLRWTVSFLGVVVLMFVAGIAVVGAIHQTAWLVTSPEPLLTGGRDGAGYRMKSQNNLKQIVLALHSYHDTNKSLPPGGTFDAQGGMMHGWQTFILPYIEEQPLYEGINFKIPWNHPDNALHFQTPVPIYLLPRIEEEKNAQGFALSHYAANVHVLGGDSRRTFKSITDGLANTLLIGEASGNYKPWGNPTNWRDPMLGLNKGTDGFGGPWPGHVNFAFADGSVHYLSDKIDPKILRALSTPAGGELDHSIPAE